MEAKKFLHGTLEVTIFHATPFSPSFPLGCLSAGGKPAYVTIKVGQQKMAKTTSERSRVWNQSFQILCAHPIDSTISITMKTKCRVLGKIHFEAHHLVNQQSLINGFFPLLSEGSGKPNPKLGLQFILWFKPAELEPTWGKLIEKGDFHGLRNATFPQRSNCKVILYHDAHHLPSFHQNVVGVARNLWEDVYKAIEDAKHLIYIAGWSLNPKMVLVRDPETSIPRARGVQIGELLKQKAEEGVAVRIMLWDDETSIPLVKNKGLMRTHDEDAFHYFKGTRVICRLCPRLHNRFPTLFSHHQKTITVDARLEDSSPSNREIMSFVGGVDLCDGRYDTEQHSLFRTLNKESHAHDFYQTNIAGASIHRGGPREPWHDAHACVTGEAAWDVLANFEQRWTKQCNPSSLLPITTIGNLDKPTASVSSTSDRNWNVQVFRSIDSFSASRAGSISTERSIHEAYVEAIRKADRFIYIENQYFLGGCNLWERDQSSGCQNLIPIEIALKVANKIRLRERFAVYVVIPMWPEGLPESDSVQEMLHWTRETMAMMYRLIGDALKETGLGEEGGHPKDYLNFFCLANREEKHAGEFVPPMSPHPSTFYWKAQMSRRFMIYVHSKLMIVDDRYMIIGSANINQRSMDGARDTEIAIGCYQTQLGDETQQMNVDNIGAFRKSLWYEHTGVTDQVFEEPHGIECVDKLRCIGQEMWNVYSGDKVVDMNGVHLLSYPLHVKQDGCLEDLPGCTNFPDTHTPIKGRRSKILPPILTT